jgi:SAM-dependent methyltransferase
MIRRFLRAGAPDTWQARQDRMEREYQELLEDGDHAARGFENDYGAIAPLLASYRGRIVDIGGGVGVTRHWLPRPSSYVLVEPSMMWRDKRWSAFANRFPCLRERPAHVSAYGESLPFSDATFDVALCLWSLNHANDPARAVREAMRVLVRGGRLLIVLEDSEPSWGDLRRGDYPSGDDGRSAATAWRKLVRPVVGWPVQHDHVAVSERAVINAARGRLIRRGWVGLYLTLEFAAE